MRGLLLKDWYILCGKLKVLLFLMLLLSIIPNSPIIAFSVIYGAMFPASIMSFDEYSKWNKLARAMPYRPADLTLSKYLLGYIFMCLPALVATLSTMLLGPLAGRATTLPNYLLTRLIPSLIGGFLVLALSMPLQIRLGAERGQKLVTILTIGLMLLFYNVVGGFDDADKPALLFTPSLLLVLAIAVVALNILSVFISIHFYKVKEG